jgi:hypothetical protein
MEDDHASVRGSPEQARRLFYFGLGDIWAFVQ